MNHDFGDIRKRICPYDECFAGSGDGIYLNCDHNTLCTGCVTDSVTGTSTIIRFNQLGTYEDLCLCYGKIDGQYPEHLACTEPFDVVGHENTPKYYEGYVFTLEPDDCVDLAIASEQYCKACITPIVTVVSPGTELDSNQYLIRRSTL